MLIVCPSCASEYVIDTDRVGAEGRSVRCAACRETWFISPDDVAAAVEAEMTAAMMEAVQSGPEDAKARAEAQASLDAWEAALAEAIPVPDAKPEDTPLPEPRSGPRPPVKVPRRARLSPTAAIGLSMVAGLGLAVFGRTTVVRAMPQSAGLYARIGLPVNLRGLDLRDVVAFQTQGDGAQLVVEGDVVGVAPEGAPVPPIEVEVRDGRDQPLYRWSVAPPRRTLENRETARFRASLSAPPAEARSIRVRFSQPSSQVPSAQRPDPTAKTDGTRGHP
ncbi:zinc-ribbon domain-containing protein [Methylobacterium sp. J-090]|uniref:zinc-ribbon domain-containing protein n=1 Tax=Methylobacterium sp. J-090 TaxID=2836666 RepID=UPI001FBB4E20|nr:zinc-ribbon domain-containing protein [Methylobacterium sp. J-090]MCJ2081465.1 zinc-ribbon domain-containing protein [Methylobacterium sp. J-090]